MQIVWIQETWDHYTGINLLFTWSEISFQVWSEIEILSNNLWLKDVIYSFAFIDIDSLNLTDFICIFILRLKHYMLV